MSILSNIDNSKIVVEELMNDREYFYSSEYNTDYYIYITKDKKKKNVCYIY